MPNHSLPVSGGFPYRFGLFHGRFCFAADRPDKADLPMPCNRDGRRDLPETFWALFFQPAIGHAALAVD